MSGEPERIADIWAELERKAESCRRTWGMGFPVISVELLKPYMRRMVVAARNPVSGSTPPEQGRGLAGGGA